MILLYLIYVYGTDCSIVIDLAIQLNLNVRRPSVMNELISDCCSSSSISCDGNNRVTRIEWTSMGLNGRLNSSTQFPNLLVSLNLERNSIQGQIPDVFPPSLASLDLSRNLLNGTVMSMPSGVSFLSLCFNAFTGNIPAFPQNLLHLDINWNKFYGTIPTISPSLMFVDVSYNLLTGNIPVILAQGIRVLYVNNNFMSGDLPLFPNSLLTLFLGELYPSNSFSGTLVLNTPERISIYANLVTDIQISSLDSLIYCELSFNPLLDNPVLAQLPICTKTGLYYAALLPNTKTTSSKTSRATTQSQLETIAIIKIDSIASMQQMSFNQSSAIETKGTKTNSTILNFHGIALINSISLYYLIVIGIHLMVDSVILGIVVIKTPIKREFRNMLKKRGIRENKDLLGSIGV